MAEDDALLRAGVAALLAELPDVEIVASVSDGPSLLAAVEEHHPDVVLTDVRMPPTKTTEGIEAARRIRAEHPGTGVLVLSQYVDGTYVAELLEGGAGGVGYLLKERVGDVTELARALREVADGGTVLDPRVVDALVQARRRDAESPLVSLTSREREVLSAMAEGKSNAAIAASLFLSERAIEKHINSLFSKLGLTEEPDVNRRVMAVLTLLREAP